MMAALQARDCLRSEIAPTLEQLITAGGDAAMVQDLVRLRDLATDHATALLRAIKDRANPRNRVTSLPGASQSPRWAFRYQEPGRKRVQAGNRPETRE
jgi:hypothetical protein